MTPQNNLEVKGNILDHPLAEILAEIAQSALNGSLKLSHGEQKIVIYFDGGDVIFAASNSRQDRLFHILLREEKILPSELTKIPNFANDMELKINLIKAEILTEKEADEFFSVQIRQILQDALEWHEGSWTFSPLVRLKADIRFSCDLPDMLFSYGRKIPAEKIVRRFKSLEERFGSQYGNARSHKSFAVGSLYFFEIRRRCDIFNRRHQKPERTRRSRNAQNPLYLVARRLFNPSEMEFGIQFREFIGYFIC